MISPTLAHEERPAPTWRDRSLRACYRWLLCGLVMLMGCGSALADSGRLQFDDRTLQEDLILPEWFKLSFLELYNDIEDARAQHKKGLILYFGQKDCPYCKAHLEKNWRDRGVVAYTRQHFDVVAIDVRGDRPVQGFDGRIYRTEKEFAASHRMQFTPSFLFLDLNGNEVFRLAGYHAHYQFQAVLEYVADEHYRKERFSDYLARGVTIAGFEQSELNTNKIFVEPPYLLDRSRKIAKKPTLVFFERPSCHSCDILHSGPLREPQILDKLKQLEVIQLDLTADTPVVTPSGHTLSARQWARNLELFYAPTLLFIDEEGMEILRIDSVVWFYRLNSVLDFIVSRGYKQQPNYQLWRQQHQQTDLPAATSTPIAGTSRP